MPRIPSPLRPCFTAIAAVSWLMIAPVLADEGPRFEVDPFWPKTLPNNWIIGQVADVDVDAQQHIWIVHRPSTLSKEELGAMQNPPLSRCCIAAPPVIEFDQAGNVVQAWGGPGAGYDWPGTEHGIRVDDKDFVWLGGNGEQDGMVLKFTRAGKFVMQIGHAGPSKGSNDTTQLGRPADIAVDLPANEIYVADGYGNHRIIVFDSETGAYKRHWGAYGKPPTDEKLPAYDPNAPVATQFRNPVHCVKLSVDGLVYVCDRTNDRMQVFRKDGTFLREVFYRRETRSSGSVYDLALWPDGKQSWLIGIDGANSEIRVLRRSDDQVVSSFGRTGRNAGEFHNLHGVALDRQGNIYTAEVGTGARVQKFRNLNGVTGP